MLPLFLSHHPLNLPWSPATVLIPLSLLPIRPFLSSWLQFQPIWWLLGCNLLCSAETWPGTHHLSVCTQAHYHAIFCFAVVSIFKPVIVCFVGAKKQWSQQLSSLVPSTSNLCLSQHVTLNHNNTHNGSVWPPLVTVCSLTLYTVQSDIFLVMRDKIKPKQGQYTCLARGHRGENKSSVVVSTW